MPYPRAVVRRVDPVEDGIEVAPRVGELQRVLPDLPLPEQDISQLSPSRRWVSRIVRAYVDFCQAQAMAVCDGRPAE